MLGLWKYSSYFVLCHVLQPRLPQSRWYRHSLWGVCLFHYFQLLLLTALKPDPYSYDPSTVDDPSSLFVQVMHEQEDRYFAIFPAAKKAAEYHKRRKEAYFTFLHSSGHPSESAQLNHQAEYHTSLSDYYLGQQPQDVVSGAISDVPQTPVSQPFSQKSENCSSYYSSSVISLSPFRHLKLMFVTIFLNPPQSFQPYIIRGRTTNLLMPSISINMHPTRNSSPKNITAHQ